MTDTSGGGAPRRDRYGQACGHRRRHHDGQQHRRRIHAAESAGRRLRGDGGTGRVQDLRRRRMSSSRPAQGADIKAKLEVGGVTETVTVASSSEIIQTQSTTVSIDDQHQPDHQAAADHAEARWTSSTSCPASRPPAAIATRRSTGLPQGVINITLDGINIQDNTNRTGDGFFAIVSPRLDAIEEVSVTTAGQGAEAGQGAVQIKFVTRVGRQQLHRQRLSVLPERQIQREHLVQQPRPETEKADLLQHQFGGRFGGPLLIPGLLAGARRSSSATTKSCRQPSDTTRKRTLAERPRRRAATTRTAARRSTCLRSARPMRRPPLRRLSIRRSAHCWATSAPRPSTGGRSSRCDANLDQLRSTSGRVQAPLPDRPHRLQRHR